MKVLLVGNTGYVTEEFVEEAFPEWQKYTMAEGKIEWLSVPLLSEEPVIKSWKRQRNVRKNSEIRV